jgi:hypothetical protein
VITPAYLLANTQSKSLSRKSYSIDASTLGLSADAHNVRILIQLPSNISWSSLADSIILIDANGKIVPIHKVVWNTTTREASFWVQIPALRSNAMTSFDLVDKATINSSLSSPFATDSGFTSAWGFSKSEAINLINGDLNRTDLIGDATYEADATSPLFGGLRFTGGSGRLHFISQGLMSATGVEMNVIFRPEVGTNQSSIMQDLSLKLRLGWGLMPPDSGVKTLVTLNDGITTLTWEDPRQTLQNWHQYSLCVQNSNGRIISTVDGITLADTLLNQTLGLATNDSIELGGSWGSGQGVFDGYIASAYVRLNVVCELNRQKIEGRFFKAQ